MSLDAVALRRSDVWPAKDAGGAVPSSGISHSAEDHFVIRDGQEFAGTHIILDLWGASHLDQLGKMDLAFRDVVETCGATLLHLHLHHFTPNDGISGVAVLAESHISVHTWPERAYAAFDIFMCGDAKPELAPDVLARHFVPERLDVQTLRRGIVVAPGTDDQS